MLIGDAEARSVVRACTGRRIALAALRTMVARAAMAPTPAMQWKAVGGSIVTILPIRTGLAVGAVRTIAALGWLRLGLPLAAGDE